MKQFVVVGVLAGALAAAPAFAQGSGVKGAQGAAGREMPRPQPATGESPAPPSGDVMLGSVRLSRAVKADGKDLPAGTYQVRVTSQPASPDAKGETAGLERWLEFVQRGQVKGREVVSIVPRADIKTVEKDTPPPANGSKFELLKGGDYVRLWINHGGNHYLVHFPVAG